MTHALKDLLPAVLAAVRHPEDDVAMAVVPFLVSWVARLKSIQKRTGTVPAVSLCTVLCPAFLCCPQLTHITPAKVHAGLCSSCD